ncbi:sigma-70 family RNA polymerase sigma factor [Mesobacillus maritimus]|uniref:sigma-70 family RNA polymerase sigma factor n=1 Tax=Mesobacillus maritimus TaxID=1643336 RepID=UPI00203A6748|nr:sigma-70 family RNA polymerase sigma factor [Mesobacillus maritimus]MCM3671264.1 sigma-70 family RNA polymerase sigma factor [Mesobacillus maritimus]
MEKTPNNDFIVETRKLKNRFEEMIQPFSSDLWNYCRYVTGSPWDGEDLFQDTMIKSFGLLPQQWDKVIDKKSYLFRIATNTWLDQCRKRKREIGSLDENAEERIDFTDTLILEEVLISLQKHLTPKQTTSFLLFDVFHFNADEVAGIVKSTPGGVYATVQRVRKKIQLIDFSKPKQGKTVEKANNETIKAYLKAFNDGDLEGMLSLYSDHAQNEAYLGFQEFNKNEIRKGSLRFGLPGHTAEEVILWNKPVIIVFSNAGEAPEIHDIQIHEVENGKIVSSKSYFFRREFIFAAATDLGFKVQMVKPPVNWS